MQEARLSRVYEYLTESLKKKDALEANVGSVNCGLMQIAIWLDEAIGQDIAIGPLDVDRLKHLSPAIETYLKVTRQIDRFAQIQIRATESRKPHVSNDKARNCDVPTTLALHD